MQRFNYNMKNFLKNIISKYVCDHEYKFVRNIYGDEINQHNGMRSIWKCIKCDKIQYREDYHTTRTLCEELDNLYDNFYKDKYNSWKELRSETINYMLKTMREAAYKGNCYIDIVLCCEEKYNDKNYYEKWLDENGLKHECNLHNQGEKCDEINYYKYHISWKYKY